MKRKIYPLAAALALALAACTNPATPPANNAPTATFPAVGFRITGTISPDATGTYTSDGIFNGYLKYKQDSGSYVLFRFVANSDSLLHWGLDESAATPIDLTDTAYYAGTASVPADSGWGAWVSGTGSSGIPLVEKLPISGKTEVGGALMAHYTFQDPDGDVEGATTFQWYLFDSSTETDTGLATVPTGVGANSVSYTIDAGDDGKWLRIEITAVDEHGAAGTPALSASVKIGTTNNAPGATFPPTGCQVSGAGTAATNGNYSKEATLFNGFAWYTLTSGPYYLFKFPALNDSKYHWGIHNSTIAIAVNWSTVTYYIPESLLTTTIESTWAVGTPGTAPAPTVLRMPISGSAVVGGTLTGHYIFTDPDGDAEVATTFAMVSLRQLNRHYRGDSRR